MQNVSSRASFGNRCSLACPAMFNAENNKSAMATLRRNKCTILCIFLFEQIVNTIKRLPTKAKESTLNSTAVKIGCRVSCRERSEMISLGGISGAGGPKQDKFPGTARQGCLAVVRLSILFLNSVSNWKVFVKSSGESYKGANF